MATDFVRCQYLNTSWLGGAANSYTYTAPGQFAAVGALSRAFVRLGSTGRTAGGPYNATADVANNVFGLTARFTAADQIAINQELSQDTALGFGLEIWEYTGAAGGPNEFIVRAQGEASGDVTGLAGIGDSTRCIPFLTGIRSDLASAAGQEMTGALTLDPDGTTLRWHRGGAGAGTTTYSYAIVEFTGRAWDVASVLATGLGGTSGSIAVPDVGDWARAFIEPQWAAEDDPANGRLFARVRPGASTAAVDWQTGIAVSGAALAVHIARHPLIAVGHGTFSKASPSPGNWYGPTVPTMALARTGLIATIANDDPAASYVSASKQCRFRNDSELRFWGSQGNGTLEVAYQIIDFGQETTPALAAAPAAAAAMGESVPPSVTVATGGALAIPAAARAWGRRAGGSGQLVAAPIAVPAAAVAWGRGALPLVELVTLAVASAAEELAAEHVASAWLVLVTLEHPDLEAPLRFSSDAVDTVSQGHTFSPMPFRITLPDDVEARAPRAQLQVDNTSQEVIAALRGLVEPLAVTLQIVRSSAPDVVEREWQGLEWRASSYDVAAVSGALGVDDMASEEFPFETFDTRFPGLFP